MGYTLPDKGSISFKILYLHLIEQKTVKEISDELKLSKHQIKKIIKELPKYDRSSTVSLSEGMDEYIKRKF